MLQRMVVTQVDRAPKTWWCARHGAYTVAASSGAMCL